MIKISLKRKAVVILIISGALTAVIIFFIILPAAQRIKNLQKYINTSEEEVEGSYQKTSKLKTSVKKLGETTKNIEQLAEMTSDRSAELRLITMFESIAEKNHITQNLNVQFVPSNEAKKKDAGLKDGGYYIFTFKNTGLFQDHMRYLRQLEDTPLYMTINDITLKKNAANNQQADSVAANFSAKIYSKD